MEPVSLKDKRIIEKQLGRIPRGLLGIECRCRYGYPQVVTVYPLIEGKPFPTIFWLTCPFLANEIDHLEATGWVKRMETRVRENQVLAARLQAAHLAYINEKYRFLTEEDRVFLEEAGMLNSLLEKGIGGTADFTRIKCLHLHVAHALARENPIGEHVLEVLSEHACPPEQVVCSEF